MVPAAVVISAVKNRFRKHVAIIGDRTFECAGYEEGFGEMLLEPDPVREFTDKAGVFHHVHKHSLYWAGYEPDYKPRSPESLAKSREKRRGERMG